jgi:cbb3-type cytochrome oxidase subunit 3
MSTTDTIVLIALMLFYVGIVYILSRSFKE